MAIHGFCVQFLLTGVSQEGSIKNILFAECKYQKPKRICPFCNKWETRLKRHILNVHKEEAGIDELAQLPKNSVQARHAFDAFRKRGIFKENHRHSSKEKPVYHSERRCRKGNLVLCTNCKGFYGRNYFHRHKESCNAESAQASTAVSLAAFQTYHESTAFSTEILSKFQDDEVGNMCCQESTILLIGEKFFENSLKKVGKLTETRKPVMTDMRLLARLYMSFKGDTDLTAADIFKAEHFPTLQSAIDDVTISDAHKLKQGIMHRLFYLLKSAAAILMASYNDRGDDNKASDTEEFCGLLNLNQYTIFGDVTGVEYRNQRAKSRVPEQQVDEEDVTKMRDFTLKTIASLSSEFDPPDKYKYVQLRNALCCRLTMFNGRFGSEPCRLTLTNYDDALNERLMNESQVHDLEKKLFKDMLICLQAGKANRTVPVLIPKDCIPGIRIMIDPAIRNQCGVNKDSTYVFPNIEKSLYHVSCWECVSRFCVAADVGNPRLLTASAKRHRVSVLYAALELTDSQRQAFYAHAGHPQSTATDQHSPATLEPKMDAGHLHTGDLGKTLAKVLSLLLSKRSASSIRSLLKVAGSHNLWAKVKSS